MDAELTKEDVRKLMDRLESTFKEKLFACYDQECQWNMLWEKYNDFVKNFLSNFFKGQGMSITGSLQMVLGEPLENMPLYINEWEGCAAIAIWRMEISK